jgi:predicted DNA-binding ribbon-helix-helix protein
MAKDLKRSLTIAGHRTSLSLEQEFWAVLKLQAESERKTVAAVVEEIDTSRGTRNLSSAIRVWILERVQKAQDQR